MKDVNEVKTERARSYPAAPRWRWPWVAAMLLWIVGVVGAVVRYRRLRQRDPEWSTGQPGEQPTMHYRDQVATAGSPTGNGVVRAETQHP